MTTLERLSQWKNTGAITGAQFDAISALVRNDRFSVFLELNALLYLGVLSFVAGVGWTIQTYFARLGDLAILTTLTVLLGASFYYCFSRALPFSAGEEKSPNLAFDYALYFGCLLFGIEMGYLESRFQLLQSEWDYYLLVSSVLFFVLAYRFDNRFVLSLALSTLGAWFGFRINRFAFRGSETLRISAIVYGVLVAFVGTWFHRLGLKKHFLETYLHVAANVLFVAVLSGVGARDSDWLYLTGLLALSVAAVVLGIRFRRFVFVIYGTIYGYIGISIEILRGVSGFSVVLTYVVISSALVVLSMVLLARWFGREE